MTKRLIAELVSHLKTLDVQLFIENNDATGAEVATLRCTAPKGTLTDELRQELSDRKAELIAYLQKDELTAHSPLSSPISASTQPTSYTAPLSFAQERLWFFYQLLPNNPFYNIPAAIRLIGCLDRAALERSFQIIGHRHAALRTRFITVEGQPVQVVEPQSNIELEVVNLQTVAVSDRDRISQQLSTTEAQRPFNLTTDPPLRLTLLTVGPTESVLLLTMHHIVADGWSLGVLMQELASCYAALAEGRSPTLSPLPIQYPDFARWQRDTLQGDVLNRLLTYWRAQLQDLPPLELPRDRPRPAVQSYKGATVPLQISPALTQALAALSQSVGVSLFMTLLAAFQTLLYRYTGQDDIAIGSPIANRHHTELEGLIGFFVNSLVLRCDLSGNPSFRTLLERVRAVALAAYEHQDLPFEKLVEDLDPDRDLSQNPLFQVAFALQNAPMQALTLPKLTLEPSPLDSHSTRFDLEVHLWEPTHGLRSLWQSQEGLSGFIVYSTDLFERDRINRLVGHFQTLLEGIAANSDARLSDLPLLTAAERQQTLVNWNQPSFDAVVAPPLQPDQPSPSLTVADQPLCFHHLFAAQVAHHPDAIALVTDHASLTYRDLDQRAEQLAHVLHRMGVQPNALVGLCVERSVDMLVGILGIFKAGGAYVPLDPNYPRDRLHLMLTDTGVAIVLTQSRLIELLPRSQATILCLDQSLEAIEATLVEPPNQRLQSSRDHALRQTSDSPAYVIYTSGSTGIPKGVVLTHRGLCNVVAAQQQVFDLSRNSRVLQFSSLSFDASIFEIAMALGSGGTLYLPPPSAQLPGMALVQFLQDHAITHALLTPAVLAVLPPATLPDLGVLITGGDTCSNQVVDRWSVGRRFFNAYGPTEATIWATVAQLHPGDHPLTIGRPILNTQVYILDAHLNLLPAGIPGELYIGGIGLAQGYLNRPDLTAERFISCQFAVSHELEASAAMLYRTGDRAQYRSDGTIEFLGRIDNQIKLRGFRVELGEIEATLQQHPAIREAAVIPRLDGAETRLIAYFSLNEHYIQQAVRSLQTQHVHYWQTLYDQTYQTTDRDQQDEQKEQVSSLTAAPAPNTTHDISQFDITGWNSSYTGQPIPLEQMQEWVSDRVQQILALQPKRVLEIGCGTGLLLFQIAPHCQQYVGTDFSVVSLRSLQTRVDHQQLAHVTLLHRAATDFTDIDIAAFDVVILNSVVQYFPDQDYLMQVVSGAIQALAPQGVLFVGDVRSLPLLTAFHSWMKFCQAVPEMERNQLHYQIERSQFEAPELAVDPAFFQTLRDQYPQIQQVNIRLSRGHSHNEMTQFRYNVLLHVKPRQPHCTLHHRAEQNGHCESVSNSLESEEPSIDVSEVVQYYNWKTDHITLENVKTELSKNRPEILAIANVTNSRIWQAVNVANWLGNKRSPKTVGRMRDWLQRNSERASDPQDWWDLETVLPYNVEITWSTQTNTGDYDVLLTRRGIHVNIAESRLHPDLVQHPYASQQSYTNHPLQANVARQLIPELRHYLQQRLPDYMVPFTVIPIAALPLTVNGKVDRTSLEERSRVSVAEPLHCDHSPVNPGVDQLTSAANSPLSATESALVKVWQDLLQLGSVSIRDNFFELGGHSLLATQMTSRVRDAFEVELPLHYVFEAPTIAQLAPILETLRNAAATPTVPPLVRLDRAAYRRKRSTLPSAASNDISIPSNPALVPSCRPLARCEQSEDSLPIADVTQRSDDQQRSSALVSRSPLIPLSSGNSKQPFFCVHPMFGVVFPYLELAYQLESHRSFYGLQPLGLDGTSRPLNRIEAIATHYIHVIQTRQPHGPYFLGGWSFGGLVAYEMAQQLTRAGQIVELLAVLDTPAPCYKPSLAQSLKFLLGTALWSTLPFLLDYGAIATHQLGSDRWSSRRKWSTVAASAAFRAIVQQLPDESRLQLLDESAIRSLLPIVYANSQATFRYVPRPYPKRLTLFRASEQPGSLKQEPALGWDELVNDIQLHQVPGNHLSLLKQPHVQTLAEQLRQCLV